MSASRIRTEYTGRKWRLFLLTLKTSLLTLLTLGFYRFWMKTRLRRWFWSAIRPGGQPLEYTGDPIEKLLGFLMAVVVLAFYIGIVNLVLVFLSFSLLNDNTAAYAASFIGVIPLVFFARYRARRYILARTRWRGIRFGMEPAAWAYSLRAMGQWLLTILTLGFLYPRQVFNLEKFRTDRTFYGSARLHQGGDWKLLRGAAFYNMYAAATLSIAIVALVQFDIIAEKRLLWLFITGAWFLIGLLWFRVHAFRTMANHKSADGIGLIAEPRLPRVLGIYLLGYTLAYLILVLFIGLCVFAILFGAQWLFDVDPLVIVTWQQKVPTWVQMSAYIFLYFSIFILWSVLHQVFVALPLQRHYAQTLTITNPVALSRIRQRDRDHAREAGGFAEALDLGAAI